MEYILQKGVGVLKFIPTPFYDKPLPLFIVNPYPFFEKHYHPFLKQANGFKKAMLFLAFWFKLA